MEATANTVKIEELAIPNTVSIYRATVAPPEISRKLQSETMSQIKKAEDKVDTTSH